MFRLFQHLKNRALHPNLGRFEHHLSTFFSMFRALSVIFTAQSRQVYPYCFLYLLVVYNIGIFGAQEQKQGSQYLIRSNITCLCPTIPYTSLLQHLILTFLIHISDDCFLIYVKNVTTQLKGREKMMDHYTCSQKGDEIFSQPSFSHESMRGSMRSADVQCKTRNGLNKSFTHGIIHHIPPSLVMSQYKFEEFPFISRSKQ